MRKFLEGLSGASRVGPRDFTPVSGRGSGIAAGALGTRVSGILCGQTGWRGTGGYEDRQGDGF